MPRDAVKAVLGAHADVGALDWSAVEDLDDAARLTLPAGVVCCVGPEQDRPEMTTNTRSGLGYPVAVMLLGSGTSRGEKQFGVSGLTLSGFRQAVRTSFHLKRLSGIAQVAWCEVSDSGPLVDDKSPLFQKLQTAVVVTAVGRFARS